MFKHIWHADSLFRNMLLKNIAHIRKKHFEYLNTYKLYIFVGHYFNYIEKTNYSFRSVWWVHLQLKQQINEQLTFSCLFLLKIVLASGLPQ